MEDFACVHIHALIGKKEINIYYQASVLQYGSTTWCLIPLFCSNVGQWAYTCNTTANIFVKSLKGSDTLCI